MQKKVMCTQKKKNTDHRSTTNMHIFIKITVILKEVTGTFLSLCIPIVSQKTQASTAEVWAVQRGSAAGHAEVRIAHVLT